MISNTQIQELFPTFQKELIETIKENATITEAGIGTIIMRTGQYIKNTVLVTKGKIKIYREDDDGKEFFMYY